MNRPQTTEKFVEKAKQRRGNEYDYSKVKYSHSNTNITIVCRKHGEFQQTPSNHLGGAGCPSCGYEKNIVKHCKTQEFMIAKFKKAHGDKYNYDLVKYKHCLVPIEIVCKTHGSFMQTPANHYRGRGCQLCGLANTGRELKTLEDFLTDAQKVHGDRYSYEKSIYRGTDKKLTVTCEKHGDFEVIARDHLNGSNCVKCLPNGRSVLADKWLDSLGIKVREYVIPGTRYKVDGYDPENRICYEFLGVYWHGHPDFFNPEDTNPTNKRKFGDLYRETLARIEYIRLLGYKIIVKWEHD